MSLSSETYGQMIKNLTAKLSDHALTCANFYRHDAA